MSPRRRLRRRGHDGRTEGGVCGRRMGWLLGLGFGRKMVAIAGWCCTAASSVAPSCGHNTMPPSAPVAGQPLPPLAAHQSLVPPPLCPPPFTGATFPVARQIGGKVKQRKAEFQEPGAMISWKRREQHLKNTGGRSTRNILQALKVPAEH
uniref:Uncharacterized protein n=2 Tax=Oryza TaxID=4527 RepID=A0A0E0MY85_ORYRU